MKTGLTVFDLFRRQAEMHPDKPALIYKGKTTTYSQLLKIALELGRAFSAHGIVKGTHIGMIMRNRPEFVTLLYAAHITGAVMVPMNFRNNPFELERQLNYSKCKFVFYEDELRELTVIAKAEAKSSTNWIVLDGKAMDGETSFDEFAALTSDEPFPEICGSDNALMLFSGGTTGVSKLAVHTHEGLYNWVTTKADAPRQALLEDVFLMSMPMCHSAGLGMLHDMLSNGSTVIISGRFVGEDILGLIEKYRVTQAFLIPPTLCRRLEETVLSEKHDLSSVRMVTLAGGTVTQAVTECCFRVFPNASLCVVYAHSERAVFTMQVIKRNEPVGSFVPGSVGKPYMACQISLRDENGKVVPDGQPGIAWAHSSAQMAGYLNCEEKFVDGWLNTGDVLRRESNGNYVFLSRVKDCIKTGGENVFASELEQVISSCKGVTDCCVFGMPDEIYREAVCAAIISDGTADAEEIVAFCRKRLASYKKPRKIYFVDSFPKTAIGKTNKKELASRLENIRPDYEILSQ